jgi:hypothetical protein
MPDHRRLSARNGLIAGAFVVAAVLFVALSIWPSVTKNPIGHGKGGVNPATAPDTTQRETAPAQRSGESEVAKAGPAHEGSTVGLAGKIKGSAKPLSINDTQREELRKTFQNRSNPAMQKVPFEMMIGSAVPSRVKLAALPAQASQILNGYSGDQYLLVQDELVIVDAKSHRVAAIIPGVG